MGNLNLMNFGIMKLKLIYYTSSLLWHVQAISQDVIVAPTWKIIFGHQMENVIHIMREDLVKKMSNLGNIRQKNMVQPVLFGEKLLIVMDIENLTCY